MWVQWNVSNVSKYYYTHKHTLSLSNTHTLLHTHHLYFSCKLPYWSFWRKIFPVLFLIQHDRVWGSSSSLQVVDDCWWRRVFISGLMKASMSKRTFSQKSSTSSRSGRSRPLIFISGAPATARTSSLIPSVPSCLNWLGWGPIDWLKKLVLGTATNFILAEEFPASYMAWPGQSRLKSKKLKLPQTQVTTVLFFEGWEHLAEWLQVKIVEEEKNSKSGSVHQPWRT